VFQREPSEVPLPSLGGETLDDIMSK